MARRTEDRDLTRPIVTVIYDEVASPVVRSQTPPLLRAWRESGRSVDAAVFTSPRGLVFPRVREAHRTALAAFEEAIGRAPWTKTHLPRDLGLRWMGRSLARAVRRRGMDGAILFCRQPRAAIAGIAARDELVRRGGKARVVLDLRGLRDEEYLLTLGKSESDLAPDEKARLDVYRRQEAAACVGADAVLCVSRPMMRAVAQRHGVAQAKLGRAPNHAGDVGGSDDDRAAARRELGVPESALLFVYSGTLPAWQNPERCALLVNAVRLHRPDARLLFLTPDVGPARAAAKSVGMEDALYRTARDGDVDRLLGAADYGLLLRDESIVNRVSCPVKFGEYLACGVRPVMTPQIGDQSDACAEAGLGVVVGLADAALAAKQIALDASRPGTIDAAGRARRRAWAAEHISAERVATRIAEFVDGVG